MSLQVQDMEAMQQAVMAGFDDMQEIVSVAQEQVGCDDETYGGRLGFVDTKPYFKEEDESPQAAVHHFNNNAETYLNIGKALGRRDDFCD